MIELSGGIFGLIFASVIGLMIVLLIYGVRAGKKRREAFFTWAQARGWTYVARDPQLHKQFTCPPFDSQGEDPHCSEVLSGSFQGRTALSCTYTYSRTTSSTDSNGHSSTSTTNYDHHVVMLYLPAWLPPLNLTRETFGTRLMKAFGAQDIQFESEAFNKAWRVTAKDLKFAHDVVNPQLMERLMAADFRGMPLHFSGQTVLTWSTGRSQLNNIDAHLTLLTEALTHVPEFVWQDHGTNPSQHK